MRCTLIFILGLVACASTGGRAIPIANAPLPPAFDVKLLPSSDPVLGADSVMGMGCLPNGSDSALFTLAIILETPTPVDGGFTVVFNERMVETPQVRNPIVSVSLYPFGTRRVAGTSCLKGAGMVLRPSLKRLWQATIAADPPGDLIIEVYTASGARLASRRLMRSQLPQTITWTAPSPPNTALLLPGLL